MTDFTTSGQPFETPIGAASESYAQTPPTFSRALGAFFGESSTTAAAARKIERSSYEAMSPEEEFQAEGWLAASDPNAIQGQPPREGYLRGLSNEPAIPTPTLSAEEANKRFAPIGPDGKQTSITDKPITEGAARLIGTAKADEIERQGVLARFAAAHSFPVTFGTGAAAFMLDPVNAASTFLPGIGEEAALAGLGRVGLATTGIAARTLARTAAGGTSAAIAQAPLSLARYGMGQEEASDYGLREAFRDVAFAAAGGAILHAGFGAAADALRARRAIPAEIPETPPGESVHALPEEAAQVLHADAPTKMDAMRAAVAQVAEGRPVDVETVFKPGERSPADVAAAQRDLYRDGFAPGVPDPELRATDEAIYEPKPETVPKPEAPPTEGAPLTEADRQLAEAEAEFKRQGEEGLHPEDKAELDQTAAELTQADQHEQAMMQAAQCLVAAGA